MKPATPLALCLLATLLLAGTAVSEVSRTGLVGEWQRVKRAKKLRQDWAGALSDVRDQYTSLELQKKSLDWRGD